MPSRKLSDLVVRLGRPSAPGSTLDADLLARFVADRDEAAFASIVSRHGPQVYGVCRRVIGDRHLAEDAFQAVFVVLATKAGSVRPHSALSAWLYGVAYRVALRARTVSDRRLRRECPVERLPEPASPASSAVETRELVAALDEEIARLPERQRVPVVVCELGGQPRQEAAAQLGISEGTLSSRLARARKTLAARLRRRGIELPAAGLAAALARPAVAAVPPGLVTKAVACAIGPGLVPATVAALSHGVLRLMLVQKLRMLVVAMGLMAPATFAAGQLTADDPVPGSAEGAPGRAEPRANPPAAGGAVAVVATAAQVSGEPAWKAEFHKAYGLRDDEVLRRVAPPYPACRAEYFRDRLDQERERYRLKNLVPPAELSSTDYTTYLLKLVSPNNRPVDRFTVFSTPIGPDSGTELVLPVKTDVGVQLRDLIQMTTGYGPTRTEADGGLPDHKVTGDFVVRAGADPGKVVAALEKILRKECDLPVSLAVAEVERDVYVLSGRYDAKPLPGRKKHQVEVFAVDLQHAKTGRGGSGNISHFAADVEGFVNARVAVGKVEGAPDRVEWHFNARSPVTDAGWARDTDPEAVMKNIAAQTGLSVKVEKRKVKMLVVKAGLASTAPVPGDRFQPTVRPRSAEGARTGLRPV